MTAENMDALDPLGLAAFPHDAGNAAPTDRGEPPCRVARIAIDSDWEWTAERFGGNAEAAAEYALFLTAAISEVYRRDVNVRLVVPFLRTWSGNNDPYTGNTSPDPLDQVRAHWVSEMGHIGRELVHLLTGANTSYGGVAYVGVLCNTGLGYGVSAYMNGSFPYPLQMNSSSNWDLVVMSHELGHNFGTLHTHDGYNPPIDRCGIDCGGSHDGTIMSYCHICSGGLINIDLRFHTLVQTVIEDYMANSAPCDLTMENAALDDSIATLQSGGPIDLYVLVNDSGPGCAAVGIASVQSPTPNGATVTIEGWDNPTGDPTGHFL
ncbi:MAG: zinc-dependent metalloprotease, partial [Phycisphaerales bacterium]|nr:zinc-dependent metalloprotease [Phycisphaerales bacterium]